jgi:hypothetical protein
VREYTFANHTSKVPFFCSQHLGGLRTGERALRVRFGTSEKCVTRKLQYISASRPQRRDPNARMDRRTEFPILLCTNLRNNQCMKPEGAFLAKRFGSSRLRCETKTRAEIRSFMKAHCLKFVGTCSVHQLFSYSVRYLVYLNISSANKLADLSLDLISCSVWSLALLIRLCPFLRIRYRPPT